MNGHSRHARVWIVSLAVAGLIAAHAGLLGFALHGHRSLALVAGVVGILLLKYAWLRLRR